MKLFSKLRSSNSLLIIDRVIDETHLMSILNDSLDVWNSTSDHVFTSLSFLINAPTIRRSLGDIMERQQLFLIIIIIIIIPIFSFPIGHPMYSTAETCITSFRVTFEKLNSLLQVIHPAWSPWDTYTSHLLYFLHFFAFGMFIYPFFLVLLLLLPSLELAALLVLLLVT